MPSNPAGLIPCAADEAAYRQVFAADAAWRPAMAAIARRHGLEIATLRRETQGSHIVFGNDEAIVKLFYAGWSDDCVAERAALEHLSDLPVPRILGHGDLAGWPYVILTRVRGLPALQVWDGLSAADQISVMRQLGSLLARIHGLPAAPGLSTDWQEFISRRKANAAEHHGLDGTWRRWIEDRIAVFCDDPTARVTLHADITSDHVFLSQAAHGWKLTSLIDFGDARLGDPLYEFIAPLAFYTFGRPELTRALLESYGLRLTPEVRARITALCLLHEFGRVQDFIDRHTVTDGEAFERALWG
jgi:hygromycin-B 7''-O-kinase